MDVRMPWDLPCFGLHLTVYPPHMDVLYGSSLTEYVGNWRMPNVLTTRLWKVLFTVCRAFADSYLHCVIYTVRHN